MNNGNFIMNRKPGEKNKIKLYKQVVSGNLTTELRWLPEKIRQIGRPLAQDRSTGNIEFIKYFTNNTTP